MTIKLMAAKYKHTPKHAVRSLFEYEYKYGYNNDAPIDPNLHSAVSMLMNQK